MTRLWPTGDPVQVMAADDGMPSHFFWHGRWHEVAAVANRWRVRSSWWLPAADTPREYVKLTTTRYCARIYD